MTSLIRAVIATATMIGIVGSVSASAQTVSPPVTTSPAAEADGPDVVVTGRKLDQEKEVRDFVGALAGFGNVDPLARFDNAELCPVAMGLTTAYDAAISTRMRQIAKAAAIPLAAADCKPNVLVIFTKDKNAFITALRRAQPAYFKDAWGGEIQVPKQEGPATAWHLEVRVDANGVAMPPVDTGPVNVTLADNAGRLRSGARPVLVASVLVVEWKAIDGLTTMQIGDYASMRTFAQIDPARLKNTTAPTIVTILEAPMDSEVPASLTDWDLNYLRALYATHPFRAGRQQRGEIARSISTAVQGKAGGR